MKKIGLMGLTFDSGNMGCCALAESFSNILSEFVSNQDDIYVFTTGEKFDYSSKFQCLCNVIPIYYNFKKPKSLNILNRYIRQCDIIFDFTDGDSFTDLYGIKRFFKVSFTKYLCIRSKSTFVLAPQTYGPYQNFVSKKIARFLLKQSDCVFSRDLKSAELASTMRKGKVECFIDVAFALPYKPKEQIKTNRKKVGINVSGLLWRGGYSGNNQFNLTVDYQAYTYQLLQYLSNNNYEIHLIPHVITKDIKNIENDFTVNQELKEKFPHVISAPPFTSPIQAKSYIASMDIFIGARMHATIAAFSSNVCTIPFSYSKKFEGLYDSMGYKYVIHGKEVETNVALQQTVNYIENMDELSLVQNKALKYCTVSIDHFKKRVKRIIMEGVLE